MNAALVVGCLVSLAAPSDGEHETLEVAAPSGPFTTLHYGTDVRVPCLWPVRGPGGIEMTRAYPMEVGRVGEADDHPHHTSLWLAHGDVNGHDFWHARGKTPRIDVVGEPGVASKDGATTVDAVLDWVAAPDETLLRETRRMVFTEADGARRIDFDLSLKALVDVEFGDTKEGTFALRLHPELRLKGSVAAGHALDSEGRKDGKIWGERCRWLTYFGNVEGTDVGVAVFDHPGNLRHPTWWHARDYGLVAANPFGIHDFDREPEGTGDFALAKGETLRQRYRVVLYAGAPDADALEAEWKAWAGQSESDADAGEGKGEPDRSTGRD
ncbi:MAG: PmoA family protein [Planctomycetota bacterium]